jgi:flagellar export protein FliJ
MKKNSLSVLHRYCNHQLEREQINLQDKLADENQQKARLLQLQERIRATHDAKAQAGSIEEVRSLDDAAAYLHTRLTLAKRAVTLTGQAREEALAQTLKTKQARDQVEMLIERGRMKLRREEDERERDQMDELVTARYAMALDTL